MIFYKRPGGYVKYGRDEALKKIEWRGVTIGIPGIPSTQLQQLNSSQLNSTSTQLHVDSATMPILMHNTKSHFKISANS